MMETIITALISNLPAIITSIAGAWLIIRQTNKKTEREAAVTNDKVETVQKGVDGNLEKLNERVDTAATVIEQLHAAALKQAKQTADDKARALADRQVDRQVDRHVVRQSDPPDERG